jgi:hypothetical protein
MTRAGDGHRGKGIGCRLRRLVSLLALSLCIPTAAFCEEYTFDESEIEKKRITSAATPCSGRCFTVDREASPTAEIPRPGRGRQRRGVQRALQLEGRWKKGSPGCSSARTRITEFLGRRGLQDDRLRRLPVAQALVVADHRGGKEDAEMGKG